MNRKHINIVSYYSDDNNNLDDIYSIDYPAGVNIKEEIRYTYELLQDQDKPTNELACMLDYLIKERGMNIDYTVIHVSVFNCDYGSWEEELDR